MKFGKKGMVAALFLGMGFVVFAIMVVSGGLVNKEVYVGKNALDTYLGGQDYHKFLFYYNMAGKNAMDEAIDKHAKFGGMRKDECLIGDYGVWYSEDCDFDLNKVGESYLDYLDESFHEYMEKVFEGYGVEFPLEYDYVLDEDLNVKSNEKFAYYEFGKKYSFFVDFDLKGDKLNEYLDAYGLIYETIQGNAECLIEERDIGGDYSLCFEGEDWKVVGDENYVYFDVKGVMEDIEISFAISLNSLEKLTLF